MKRVHASSLFIFVLVLFFEGLAPTSLYAQNRGTISGIIYEDETDATLPGAHVFLANTTIGDITNPDGYFSIENIQAGSYQLIVTIIGFKTYQQPVKVLPGEVTSLTLKLSKDVYQVGEITVTDKQPKSWKRNLTRFKRMFLGNTPNRRGCDIENPYTLDFVKRGGYFEASSKAPLTVINKALGYKITYHLNEFSSGNNQFRFTGQPIFEELEPKNERELRRWSKRRAETFAGSFRHFLRSLASETAHEEGFSFYLDDSLYFQKPHNDLMVYFQEEEAEVPVDSFLVDHPLPHELALKFSGYLHIFYENEMMHRDYYESVNMGYNPTKEPIRAVIRLIHTDAIFNEIGFLNNAFDVGRFGYWNWESGICNWLPFNYGLERIN